MVPEISPQAPVELALRSQDDATWLLSCGPNESNLLPVTVTRKVAPRSLPTSPFSRTTPPEPPTFVVGDRITHDSYGLGRVLIVHGSAYVTVDFGADAIRRIPVTNRGMLKI